MDGLNPEALFDKGVKVLNPRRNDSVLLAVPYSKLDSIVL